MLQSMFIGALRAIHLFLTREYAKRNERVIGNNVLYLESFNGTLKPICRLEMDFSIETRNFTAYLCLNNKILPLKLSSVTVV